MNEEELKNKIEECDKLIITYGKREDWDRLFSTERVKGSFQAELRGFQKGKLEQKKEDFDYLFENWDGYDKTANMIINDFKRQLQKEIDSQTEQNSDKEVAQPYSKSDKTTKGFILSDEQFQKEVDFAKKEIGEKRK